MNAKPKTELNRCVFVQKRNSVNGALIWKFSSKAANNEINRTHKRAPRMLYKNNNLSFDKCLMKEVGITILVKNLQNLMLEVFKSLNYLNPSYLWTCLT